MAHTTIQLSRSDSSLSRSDAKQILGVTQQRSYRILAEGSRYFMFQYRCATLYVLGNARNRVHPVGTAGAALAVAG